jgi:hypothetical protein
MTAGTIHQRWLDRLFSVFRESPHVLGVAQVLAAPADDTYAAMLYYLSHTDLDDREGVLLDWCGWLIGVTRPPAQEPDENLFWLCALDAVDIAPGTRGFSTLAQTEGGYMTGLAGCTSRTEPNTYMNDDDYRDLIKTKASTFRKKATLANLFTYLQRFGMRCTISEAACDLTFTPESFDDCPYWKRYYTTNKGFRPAGIKITFASQTEPEDGL